MQILLPVAAPTQEQPNRESGLVDCGVFLVWQTGSRGIPVSRSGYYVSFSATGVEVREGWRKFCYAVTPDSDRTTSDGKR